MKKHTVRSDAKEIIRRWQERNPELFYTIKNGDISLEDFAEIIIVQYKAFNCIK